MAPNPIVIPRTPLNNPVHQDRIDPLFRLLRIPTSIAFATTVALLVAKTSWARNWLASGAPVLTYLVLVGASHGYRVLPFVHLWTLLTSLNLLYAVFCTSWLLNGFFTASCWPAVILTSIFQFNSVANLARGRLRALISQLHFVHDKIAFFDIPALEIDVDVAGLLVIRGISLSLSSLTIEAQGIELGIKLSDDMELAIQIETIKVYLFRRIEVSDTFANLKGGIYEMTFGELDENTEDNQGNALMDENTPLLRAASAKTDGTFPEPEKIKMTEHMTDGQVPQDSSPKTGLRSVTHLTPSDDDAVRRYDEKTEWIRSSSAIGKWRKHLAQEGIAEYNKTQKSLRAAICSHLHDTPSVPHPPQYSIKVTTLKNSTSPAVKRFQHRFPFLLRLLLNPLSYFHPISFSSITATASGQWMKAMLANNVFKSYTEHNSDLRALEGRMSAWLADANFAFEMDNVTGLAQVPIITEYDINCYSGIRDILVFRTIPKHVRLNEVVRLGGADATFTVPIFLLPHHEHILPPKSSEGEKRDIRKSIKNADGKPQQVQAEKELEQAEKDETNVQMTSHIKLPACFDQELLNFIAALVKATKLVEMDKEPNAMDHDMKGFKDFAKSLNTATRDGFKKAVVTGVVNDRWIAKLVGKVTRMLENAQGDVGYSGSIPVSLEKYRQAAIGEATKILP